MPTFPLLPPTFHASLRTSLHGGEGSILPVAPLPAMIAVLCLFLFLPNPSAAVEQTNATPQVSAYPLPPISLRHMQALSDTTGIHEFAHGTIPWHENGYCAEDVGRALAAVTFYEQVTGKSDLAANLGFERIIELERWESFSGGDWKVTLTPSKHWGARTLSDGHRGYGGFVLEHQGRRIYHAGDSAYFHGFKEIGRRLPPEIALLPIGAYHPESFRRVHMGPDQAIKAFKDLGAKCLVPMHYGTFKLSFEDMDEPPRWLLELAAEQGLTDKVKVLEEGVPNVF